MSEAKLTTIKVDIFISADATLEDLAEQLSFSVLEVARPICKKAVSLGMISSDSSMQIVIAKLAKEALLAKAKR